jgi:hypothetical protein
MNSIAPVLRRKSSSRFHAYFASIDVLIELRQVANWLTASKNAEGVGVLKGGPTFQHAFPLN